MTCDTITRHRSSIRLSKRRLSRCTGDYSDAPVAYIKSDVTISAWASLSSCRCEDAHLKTSHPAASSPTMALLTVTRAEEERQGRGLVELGGGRGGRRALGTAGSGVTSRYQPRHTPIAGQRGRRAGVRRDPTPAMGGHSDPYPAPMAPHIMV